jgi:hypothetical protein
MSVNFSKVVHKKKKNLLGVFTQACNPSYSGSEDKEHHLSRPDWANS